MKNLKKVEFEQLSEKFKTISDENLSLVGGGLASAMSSILNDTDTTNGMSSIINDIDTPINALISRESLYTRLLTYSSLISIK